MYFTVIVCCCFICCKKEIKVLKFLKRGIFYLVGFFLFLGVLICEEENWVTFKQ